VIFSSYAAYDDEALAAMASPGLVRQAAKLLAQCQWLGDAVSVGGILVRLDELGPVKGRCPCPAAGVCVHVVAAAMFVRDGLPPGEASAPPETDGRRPESIQQPAPPPEGPSPKTKRITAAVRDEIEATVEAGIAHLGDDIADRLRYLATTARTGGLPLLSRYLGNAAALMEGLAAGNDEAGEREALAALSTVWGLCQSLDNCVGQPWVGLRGFVRREFTAEDRPLELLPLGATWWVNPSGARGITLFAWDQQAGTVRTVTSARPAGVDPTFGPSRTMTALWGAPLATLLGGPFQVEGPRMGDDGSLSATAKRVVALPSGFDRAAMRELAAKLKPGQRPVSFTERGFPVALLPVSGAGEMAVDEVAQQVVWVVPTDAGECQLRQPINRATDKRVDVLMLFQHDQGRVAYVLAQRVVAGGSAYWQPVSLFVRKLGGLELVSLDFPDKAYLGSNVTDMWHKSLALMRQRWHDAPVPAPPVRSAAGQVADDITDVLVDLAATGWLMPSPIQRTRLHRLAQQCDQLALGTAARLVGEYLEAADAPALLRLQLVCDRVAVLAAG